MVRPRAPQGETGTFLLRVCLLDIQPEISRRFLIASRVTLGQLHSVLQGVMGWMDMHLHAFQVGGIGYSDPRFDLDQHLDEFDITCEEAFPQVESAIRYDYDFGDCWRHEVVLEHSWPTLLSDRRAVCFEGEGACPPEDCGGASGYGRLLDVLADPEDPDKGEREEWLHHCRYRYAEYDPRFEGPFEPDVFDPRLANFMLRKLGGDVRWGYPWQGEAEEDL